MKKKRDWAEDTQNICANIYDTVYSIIGNAVKNRMNWETTESNVNCDIFWMDTNVNVDFCLRMKPYQFVNHFPGTGCISRKVDLSKNFFQLQKLFPDHYNFHPKSFTVPAERSTLKNYMESLPSDQRTFIIKPDLGSQGKGIYLIQDPNEALECKKLAIAQQLIEPYLIDGLKFDLRVYALVTSINPLRVYVYKEGLARFCTEKYEKPNSKNMNQSFKFLTNYSLNKHNKNFEQFHDGRGHKRSITCVFRQLLDDGVNIDALWEEIHRIIMLTIIIGQPIISHNYQTSIKAQDGKSRCFEILGFDIILDKNLKPWVLEVNHSPSFSTESDFDYQVKIDLISEALKIMDINHILRSRIINIDKQRTYQRINGTKQMEVPQLFNPNIESRIASTTGWKQIYPGPNSKDFDKILNRIEDMPKNGIEETHAFLVRRKATQSILEEMERKAMEARKEPKPFITSFGPASILSHKGIHVHLSPKPRPQTDVRRKPTRMPRLRQDL